MGRNRDPLLRACHAQPFFAEMASDLHRPGAPCVPFAALDGDTFGGVRLVGTASCESLSPLMKLAGPPS